MNEEKFISDKLTELKSLLDKLEEAFLDDKTQMLMYVAKIEQTLFLIRRYSMHQGKK